MDVELQVLNEPTYSVGSCDNVRRYDHELVLSGSYRPSSIHGLVCRSSQRETSCVVAASGGGSGVHAHSLAVAGDKCFLAVGDHVVAFELPSLRVLWAKALDAATCFGVFYVPSTACIIVHGELEISRVSLDGEVAWSAGGRDIFTGSLSVEGSQVFAEDFNGDRYVFELDSGQTSGAGA